MTAAEKKAKLFVNQVLARLKGDNDEALATKIARKALSNIQGQIAALEAKLVNDEIQVEEAQEALDTRVYPTTLQGVEPSSYAANIQQADYNLKVAVENQKATQDSIEFFKNLLKDKFEIN